MCYGLLLGERGLTRVLYVNLQFGIGEECMYQMNVEKKKLVIIMISTATAKRLGVCHRGRWCRLFQRRQGGMAGTIHRLPNSPAALHNHRQEQCHLQPLD